jgi:hypothetical protein
MGPASTFESEDIPDAADDWSWAEGVVDGVEDVRLCEVTEGGVLFWLLLVAVGSKAEEGVSISLRAIGFKVLDEVVRVVSLEVGVADKFSSAVLVDCGSDVEISIGAGGGATAPVGGILLDVDIGCGVVIIDTTGAVVDVEKVDWESSGGIDCSCETEDIASIAALVETVVAAAGTDEDVPAAATLRASDLGTAVHCFPSICVVNPAGRFPLVDIMRKKATPVASYNESINQPSRDTGKSGSQAIKSSTRP